MGLQTEKGISWCHYTFNVWHGCTKIPGVSLAPTQPLEPSACDFCYAADFDNRVGESHWGAHAPRRFFGEKYWNQPILWNKKAQAEGVRRKVFVASMADILERLPKGHPDHMAMTDARFRLGYLIEQCPHLDWLLLTKRPDLFASLMPRGWVRDGCPDNVWWGATVESAHYYRRIDALLKIKARVHFLSCEPLFSSLQGLAPYLQKINWVIAGGESGPHARPSHQWWFSDLKDDCRFYGVPFFFKQWGCWAPTWASSEVGKYYAGDRGNTRYQGHSVFAYVAPNAERYTWHPITREDALTPEYCDCMTRMNKHEAGRVLDGNLWSEMPR